MRYAIAMVAACALWVASAAAQQQYPQNPQNSTTVPQAQQQQYPTSTMPDEQQNTYPQQQYPNNPNTSNQEAQPYPQQQNTVPPAQQYPQSTYPQQQTYPQAQSTVAQSGDIPAGTQLKIRTDEDINATAQDAGRSYQAEIADNVMGPNGEILIPKGSQATLTVNSVNAGTMGVGNEEAALALQTVTINGQQYSVQTNTQTASGNRGIGANKRTAEMTGGGAVLGTVLGAVVGGAKGAAIGAVVGAAGGATAQVMTRGKEVKVPAESVLQFKLDQPIRLQGQ